MPLVPDELRFTRDNLRSLAGIYVDCGWRDQYHIHYGTRILSQRMAEAGIQERFLDGFEPLEVEMLFALEFVGAVGIPDGHRQ